MNIFVTSQCPRECAVVLPDRHVCKMIVESCQLLAPYGIVKFNGEPYGLTHLSHPCSIWTRASSHNAHWLRTHGLALCKEYEYRYGRIHASKGSLLTLQLPDGDLHQVTRFANATKFKHLPIFEAYREHLRSKPWVQFNYLRRPERRPSWL